MTARRTPLWALPAFAETAWAAVLLSGAMSAGGLGGCQATTGHGRRTPPPEAVEVPAFAGCPDPDLVLLATGGTNGLMEVCNCAGPMPGGLARRSGLFISYRSAFPRVLAADLGNFLYSPPEDLRNDFLLAGYDRLGYELLVFGSHEWSAGPARLGELLSDQPQRALATTVEPLEPVPGLTAEPVRTIELSAGKVSLVSVLGPDAMLFAPAEATDAIRRLGLPAARAAIARLKRSGHVVIALVHDLGDFARDVAARTEADLVIQGGGKHPAEALVRVAGKPLVRVGGHETVGAVALKLAGGALRDVDYRLEAVDTRWPMDHRLIQIYQAYAHAAMREALDAERTEGLAYVPSATCGRCHVRQHRHWKATAHSQAFRTLQRASRAGDPNCLMCHTSGFGTRHGFRTPEQTPALAGVNCQDCHRFSTAEHEAKGYRAAPVGEDVCTSCHTPVTDPTFDFSADRKRVHCRAGSSSASK